MGFFAALMTYLVAATLLIGGAVAGLSVLLAPSDMLSPRSAPPLVRAADRKAAVQAPKPEPHPNRIWPRFLSQSQPRTVPPGQPLPLPSLDFRK